MSIDRSSIDPSMSPMILDRERDTRINAQPGDAEMQRSEGRGKNRERRQRKNEKGDVYNLGPRWQLRGSRYAKKGLLHGIRISSRSHLNFNLDGADTFRHGVFTPWGQPSGLSACFAYLECPQVRGIGKGCGIRARCSGGR
jgi:hypothetical protein